MSMAGTGQLLTLHNHIVVQVDDFLLVDGQQGEVETHKVELQQERETTKLI